MSRLTQAKSPPGNSGRFSIGVDDNLDTQPLTHPPRGIVSRNSDEVLAAPRFPIALP